MHVLTGVREARLTGSRAIIASLIGAAFTAACSQICFYLPGNPIPVTMQVFAVVLCGMLLGGRLAALAQIEYLAIGAAGAPVFSGFKAGWPVLIGPTGGYLVAFVIAAYVVGSLTERAGRSYRTTAIAGLLGVGAIYILGRAWVAVWLGELSGLRSWAIGVAPFVGIDIAKVLAAAAIWKKTKR